jgi:hypothetical protein
LVSSPNEPGGRPTTADAQTDVPPWQSAGRGRADGTPQRVATKAPVRGADPRASRYVTGVAAPDLSSMSPLAQRPDPEPAPARSDLRTERHDVVPVEALPSELPDLSGPVPKPAPPRPADPVRAAAQAAPPRVQVGARPRGPVRATMQIRRIDPWSALKVSLLLNAALFFVWMIAVAFLYLVLGAMGVWSKLNNNVGDLLTSGSGGGGDLVSAGSIFGTAALIGLVNIVLLSAMATVGAYIYNLSTDIVGGVEVTLADLD